MAISSNCLQPSSAGVSDSSYSAFTKKFCADNSFLFIDNPFGTITHFKCNYSFKIIVYEFFINYCKRVKKKCLL